MRLACYAQIALLVLLALVGMTVRGGCTSAAGYRRLAAFKRAVQPDYYLTRGYANSREQQELPTHIRELADGSVLTGSVRISAWVKTYETCPKVVYTLDGKQLARLTAPGEYRAELDTGRFPKGKHALAVTVLDSRGRQAGRKEIRVEFRAGKD